MILSFLYIEQFRSLDRVSLNFDSNVAFRMDAGRLSCKILSRLPERFFSVGGDGGVDSVSAIIGRNGAGKTSVAAFLNRILVSGEEDLHYVCVFKDVCIRGRDRFTCIYNLDDEFNDSDVLQKLGDKNWLARSLKDSEFVLPNLSVIYYSPYYNPQSNFIWAKGAFIDISTSAMLNSSGGGSTKSFEQEEFSRIIRYVEQHGLRGASESSALPCPSEVTISGNQDLIALTQKNCINGAKELTGNIQSYRKRLRVGAGALNSLPREERRKILRHGLFDWHTKEGHSACLHYLSDALDIGRIPCAFFKIVAGYLAHSIDRTGYHSELLPRTPHLMLLADLLFDIKKRIVAEGLSNDAKGRELEVPFIKVKYAWRELSQESMRDICRYCFESLTSLYVEHEECGTTSDVEISNSWHDGFAEVVRLMFEMMDKNSDTGWDDEVVKLVIRDHVQRQRLYELLAAYRRLETNVDPKGSASGYMLLGFSGMSSGEMAYVSLFARLYECLNSFSDTHVDGRKLARHVILFMDEVETALHPEWQRRLVDETVGFVESHMQEFSAHIIFASHSPVLLSDIPEGNVCFLDRVHERCGRNANTFGANIFNLYRCGFGVDSGTWGVFAERKIKAIFIKLKERNPLSADEKKVVGLIGDDFIRSFMKTYARRQNLLDDGWRNIEDDYAQEGVMHSKSRSK